MAAKLHRSRLASRFTSDGALCGGSGHAAICAAAISISKSMRFSAHLRRGGGRLALLPLLSLLLDSLHLSLVLDV